MITWVAMLIYAIASTRTRSTIQVLLLFPPDLFMVTQVTQDQFYGK
jgi:hypothetical protein